MAKFLALFMGSPDNIGQAMAPMDDATVAAGMAAWGKWMADHAGVIADTGGPVGKTKRIGRDGISDMRNAVGGFVIVTADSQEAAAALFVNHPQFMIFPGDHVEVMEIKPIPGQ